MKIDPCLEGTKRYPMRCLRLPNTCLRDLPSLDQVPLEEVSVEGNHLSGLEGLPVTVKTLNASYNSINQDGILVPCPSVEELNLRKNLIVHMEEDDFVLHFPSVKRLQLSSNRIRHCFFLRDSGVEDLEIQENRIQVLNGLPATLRRLRADTCEIQLIQSRLPQGILTLELGYNRLRNGGLPLRWGPALRELHLDANRLESFPKNLPDSLEVLTLNKNQIRKGPQTLPPSLRILLLDSNALRTFTIPAHHRTFQILSLEDNCLTQVPDASVAGVLRTDGNWTTPIHASSQQMIQRCWRRYRLCLRLRHLLRTHKIRPELLQVSMNPDRWTQIDCLDPVWFRKDRDHIHTDRHLG